VKIDPETRKEEIAWEKRKKQMPKDYYINDEESVKLDFDDDY
jgi:hypothetical protein